MKNFKLSTLALVVGMAFSAGAMAEAMSKKQYQSLESDIESAYKADKASCDSLAGNANDICIAQAKGRKNVALAELEASYKPSIKARYEARLANAEATYAVAIERCDDKAGNAKDVCVKEAKAVKVRQSADAEAEMKAADANAVANEKADDAQKAATEKSTDAYQDAAAETRDADYVVAKEKCDILAGAAKDQCLAAAKVRFGK